MGKPQFTAIDLTRTVEPGMPLYPGSPEVEASSVSSVGKDGYAETVVKLPSHAGTHMDAPAHMIAGGRTLDRYPPETFFGAAALIDLPSSGEIPGSALAGPGMEGVEFILLRTGWGNLWGTPAYFTGYPVLSQGTAEALAAKNPKAVGIDAPSFDPIHATGHPVHRFFLGKGILLVENLVYPETLPSSPFLFACPPLKLANADGAPVRAVALVRTGAEFSP